MTAAVVGGIAIIDLPSALRRDMRLAHIAIGKQGAQHTAAIASGLTYVTQGGALEVETRNHCGMQQGVIERKAAQVRFGAAAQPEGKRRPHGVAHQQARGGGVRTTQLPCDLRQLAPLPGAEKCGESRQAFIAESGVAAVAAEQHRDALRASARENGIRPDFITGPEAGQVIEVVHAVDHVEERGVARGNALVPHVGVERDDFGCRLAFVCEVGCAAVEAGKARPGHSGKAGKCLPLHSQHAGCGGSDGCAIETPAQLRADTATRTQACTHGAIESFVEALKILGGRAQVQFGQTIRLPITPQLHLPAAYAQRAACGQTLHAKEDGALGWSVDHGQPARQIVFIYFRADKAERMQALGHGSKGKAVFRGGIEEGTFAGVIAG